MTAARPDLYPNVEGQRMAPSVEGACGWTQSTTIKPGFSVFLTDVRYTHGKLARIEGGEHLKFHFKLDGDSLIGGEHGDGVQLGGGIMSFLVQPRDSLKREQVLANAHERSVTMVCSREFAAGLMPTGREDLLDPIGEFLRDRASGFHLRTLPLPGQMRAPVEAILKTEAGALGHLMLEAKALELLYLALNQIVDPARADPMRARDQRRIDELRALLETPEGMNLSIVQLCRQLAWNETQMMQCFKQATGETISSYRQKLRMAKALEQLRNTEASITEVAMDAGYEHPSNFATAFRRAYGLTPKAARRGMN